MLAFLTTNRWFPSIRRIRPRLSILRLRLWVFSTSFQQLKQIPEAAQSLRPNNTSQQATFTTHYRSRSTTEDNHLLKVCLLLRIRFDIYVLWLRWLWSKIMLLYPIIWRGPCFLTGRLLGRFRGGGIIRMLGEGLITLSTDYASAVLEVFEHEEAGVVVEVDDGG